MMTDKQLATARAMYLDGKSTHQIAYALNVSAPGIFKALKRLGVPMRTKRDSIRLTYKNGRPRGPSEVNSIWTQERISTLLNLWREGKSGSQIADELTCRDQHFTKNAVIGKLRRLGFIERDGNRPICGHDTTESRRRAAINGSKASQKRYSALRAAPLFKSILEFPPHLQAVFEAEVAKVRQERRAATA